MNEPKFCVGFLHPYRSHRDIRIVRKGLVDESIELRRMELPPPGSVAGRMTLPMIPPRGWRADRGVAWHARSRTSATDQHRHDREGRPGFHGVPDVRTVA